MCEQVEAEVPPVSARQALQQPDLGAAPRAPSKSVGRKLLSFRKQLEHCISASLLGTNSEIKLADVFPLWVQLVRRD